MRAGVCVLRIAGRGGGMPYGCGAQDGCFWAPGQDLLWEIRAEGERMCAGTWRPMIARVAGVLGFRYDMKTLGTGVGGAYL